MCIYLYGTVFSISCTNFVLKQTAMDNKKEFSLTEINTVYNCFYVDDCLASTPTSKEAVSFREIVSY